MLGGRDHPKHIEELKRKYGGDEEHEYSEWDRSLISKNQTVVYKGYGLALVQAVALIFFPQC